MIVMAELTGPVGAGSMGETGYEEVRKYEKYDRAIEMTTEMARVNLFVAGTVQGVFYRASTLERAQSLNLTGWIKNLPDGSVELLAEGPRYALEDLVEWCRQGPPAAEVEDVVARWQDYKDEFRTFMIVR